MPPVPGISLTLNSVAGRDGHAPRPGVAAAKHNQIVAGHGRAEVPGEAGPALAPATMLLITGGSAPAIAQGYRRDPDRRSCQLRAGVSWHSYSSWGRQIVLIRGETSASRGRWRTGRPDVRIARHITLWQARIGPSHGTPLGVT